MEQTIEVDIGGGKTAFVVWRGHTAKLKPDDIAFVRRACTPFVEAKVETAADRHACERCKHLDGDERREHKVKMARASLDKKVLGSF